MRMEGLEDIRTMAAVRIIDGGAVVSHMMDVVGHMMDVIGHMMNEDGHTMDVLGRIMVGVQEDKIIGVPLSGEVTSANLLLIL